MAKAITGTYRDGRVELDELPSTQPEPTATITLFLEPGENIPPEVARFITPTTSDNSSSQLLPDLSSRLAKLQDFIVTRAQQQPSPEAAEYFQRFQTHFDAEREPGRKLFHQ